MAFDIERIKPQSPSPTVKVKERIYLDADGKATTDRGKGRSLFATPGQVIPEEAAKRVGLVSKQAKKAAKKSGGG